MQNKYLEEQAVMQIIEDETRAFWDKDYGAWADYWLHVPEIRMMGWWGRGGISITAGWDDLGDRIKQLMDANPSPNVAATHVRRENINIRISEGMAWVTFDQYGVDTGEADMDMPGLSYETRILEKHLGQWKIAYASWLLKDR